MARDGKNRVAVAQTMGWPGITHEELDANKALIAEAPTMLQAIKDLTKEINLSKLNIRKDFSLINAHACALKAIHAATGQPT